MPEDQVPSMPDQTELSYDDALLLAVRLHRDMRLDGAERLYRRLLELQPDDANAQHFLGMLLSQRGHAAQRDEAIALMRRSVMAVPTVAAWHNNLGNALFDGEEHEAAAIAYGRCSALDPDNVEVLNNLGCLLRGQGRIGEAEAAFRRALALRPDFGDAHANFATLLAKSDRLTEAFEHYSRALELQPLDPRARRLLGVVYAQSGRLVEAAAVFRDWVAHEPDNVQARHHLVAVTGDGVPERAPDDYVVDVFDKFAGSFDERLASLGYQAPQRVGEALAAHLGAPVHGLDVLDAGAGTGLCVTWLAPYARHLVGVDLSAGMLAKARARGGYDELHEAELVTFLNAHPRAFDVIVSADTLCYFGRLEGAFGGAAAALREGGLFVFTVEAHDRAAKHWLQPHGRYSHRPGYVHGALEAAGFESIDLQEVVLRSEAGKPVHGLLVAARRGTGACVSAHEA